MLAPMSYPTNERLRVLYEAYARALTTEDVEAILRRAGEEPTSQELLDVRRRVRELVQERAEQTN